MKDGGPMKCPYFSYDPEDGIDFHETEKQARERAEACLEQCRDISSSDGWPENTDEIVYGVVLGGVRETSRITREQWEKEHGEDDSFPCDGFDEMVDYAVVADAYLREDEEAKR